MGISFVILTYNSEKYIERCIHSIKRSIPGYIIANIIVVDNGSTDKTCLLLDKMNDIRAIKLPKNRGTTYSRNIAIRECNSEYIVIMDSDIEIIKVDWFHLLNQFDQMTGIIAPKLQYPDGTIQDSVKKFPKLHVRFKKYINLLFGTSISDTEIYPELEIIDFPDTAISAFWVLSQKTIQLVGLFDEIIFYSPEDVDYSARIWGNGLVIKYYKQSEIIHHTQRISHKKPISLISISFILNFLYYFAKHGYFFNTYKLDVIKSEVMIKYINKYGLHN